VKKPIPLEARRADSEQPPEKPETVKLLLSPEEAANALSISKAALYKLLG